MAWLGVSGSRSCAPNTHSILPRLPDPQDDRLKIVGDSRQLSTMLLRGSSEERCLSC